MAANLFQTIRRPVGASQTVAYTGTAGSSTALPPGTSAVWVYLSTAGYVRISFGDTVVAAVATDFPVPANVPVVLPIEYPTAPGTSNQKVFVSAIQEASGGNLHVQPLAE